MDTFDSAKPRILSRGQDRCPGSTLSMPRPMVRQAHHRERSRRTDRGVERLISSYSTLNLLIRSNHLLNIRLGNGKFLVLLRLLSMEPHGQSPWYLIVRLHQKTATARHPPGGRGFHLAEASLRLPPRVKPVVPCGGGWKIIHRGRGMAAPFIYNT